MKHWIMTVPLALVLGLAVGIGTWTHVEADPSTNQPPQLDPIGLQIVDGPSLSFIAHASDPDVPAQSLSYSLSGEPAGASINPLTGEFNWVPTIHQNRLEYFFDVVVTDSGTPALSDSVTVQVWVAQPNADPQDTTGLMYSCKINWNEKDENNKPIKSKGYTCLCNGSGTGCVKTTNGCSDAGSTCRDRPASGN